MSELRLWQEVEIRFNVAGARTVMREMIAKIEQLQAENAKLQELWVTVVLSCDPPDDCNDPVVLKRYMKECMNKANEYEVLKENNE